MFKAFRIVKAHAYRFRYTSRRRLLGRGATYEEVADVLGNSPEIVRKHYGKWSLARQSRIDDLMFMDRVYITPDAIVTDPKTMQ